MIEFKLFDNPEQSSYFSDIFEDDQDIFNYYVRPKFLQEVRNQSGVKKQAGYSKTRNCHFVSLILVCHNTGDCEFDGHSLKNTYIIKKDNKVEDAYNITDEYGEVGWIYRAAYHVLPDGKLLEFKIDKSYKKELESIYEIISNTRLYYDFENKFPAKNTNENKKNKI